MIFLKIICNLYKFKLYALREKCFWGVNVWASIMLEQLQNRSGFDNDLRKRFPFSSQIESSFSDFQKQGHALRTKNQSFKFAFTLMNLVTTENWEHGSSHLLQVINIPWLKNNLQ